MERKVKVVQIGTGKMAKYTMRYVLEKGGELVGAIDVNPAVIGKDIGEIIGGENLGVKVTDLKDAEEMLKQVKPDICIVETMSLLKDVEEPLMLCAKLGINAVSTCEEAFYSWNSNPNLTKKIDELAKQTGCTIVGTGYQDIYWGQLITSICGSTQKITKIKGSSSYNVEDYGIALANAHGAGLTLDEFDKQVASVDKISDEERQKIIESGEYLPSYMWNTNGWLCDKLGLTIKSQTQVTVPTTYKENPIIKILNECNIEITTTCKTTKQVKTKINKVDNAKFSIEVQKERVQTKDKKELDSIKDFIETLENDFLYCAKNDKLLEDCLLDSSKFDLFAFKKFGNNEKFLNVANSCYIEFLDNFTYSKSSQFFKNFYNELYKNVKNIHTYKVVDLKIFEYVQEEKINKYDKKMIHHM